MYDYYDAHLGTGEQHAAATQFADELVDYMIELGWKPPPITGDAAVMAAASEHLPVLQEEAVTGDPAVRKAAADALAHLHLSPQTTMDIVEPQIDLPQLDKDVDKLLAAKPPGLPFPNHPGSGGPMEVHHECGYPGCVNPDHLTLLTHGENSAEANRRRGKDLDEEG